MITARSLFSCAVAAGGFAFGLGSAMAQTTVTVDAAHKIRTVDDRMFGINAVMWDSYTSDARTIALVKDAGLRFVRIPGGSLSDGYHWKTGYVDGNTYRWPADIGAFATFIAGLNAQATAVANYGTGTPEEAAAWVAYANASANLQGTGADVSIGTDAKGTDWRTAGYWSALRAAKPLAADDGLNFLRLDRKSPIGIRSWEIGNENYGTWETDQQAVPHDPYTYANRAKEYIARMKAVDPSIRIGVVVTPGEDSNINNRTHSATNPRTNVAHYGWTPVMLATLKSLNVTPDALIYHRYEQAPFGGESDAGLLQSAQTWGNDAKDLRQQLSDYLGAAGAGVELVVTENNSVYSDPGKQSTSVVNGLFYADSLGNLLQTEFNGFAWWALRNGAPSSAVNNSASLYGWRMYGDYGILSTPNSFGQTSSFEPYPTYYVMKLVSHFARGGDAVVKATSDNPLLAAYAAKRRDGSVTVLVINKSPTSDTSATLALPGFTPAGKGLVYSYGIPQDEAARTGVGSTDVAVTPIAGLASSFSLTFPKYSASVVVIPTAPAIIVQPAAVSTGAGANVVLAAVATGAGGVTYQWRKDGVALAETGSALALPTVTAENAGTYDVVVTDAAGNSIASSAAAVTVSATPYAAPAATMINISTRAQVGTGDSAMIAGFTIGGEGAKKVLIRAIGPTLGVYGLSGTLADPQLEVTTLQGVSIATNDDWTTGEIATINAASDASGAFRLAADSKDSALILSLPAGQYTAIVRGADGTSGLGMVEIYDIDQTSAARLINLSTRAQVGSGAQALIGGVTVTGDRKVLLRAVGPTLGVFGVPGTIADPRLDVTTLQGNPVAKNDDWGTPGDPDLIPTFHATGAFPLVAGSKDSALILALSNGLYTGTITGTGGATGLGMIEAYEAP